MARARQRVRADRRVPAAARVLLDARLAEPAVAAARDRRAARVVVLWRGRAPRCATRRWPARRCSATWCGCSAAGSGWWRRSWRVRRLHAAVPARRPSRGGEVREHDMHAVAGVIVAGAGVAVRRPAWRGAAGVRALHRDVRGAAGDDRRGARQPARHADRRPAAAAAGASAARADAAGGTAGAAVAAGAAGLRGVAGRRARWRAWPSIAVGHASRPTCTWSPSGTVRPAGRWPPR